MAAPIPTEVWPVCRGQIPHGPRVGEDLPEALANTSMRADVAEVRGRHLDVKLGQAIDVDPARGEQDVGDCKRFFARVSSVYRPGSRHRNGFCSSRLSHRRHSQ